MVLTNLIGKYIREASMMIVMMIMKELISLVEVAGKRSTNIEDISSSSRVNLDINRILIIGIKGVIIIINSQVVSTTTIKRGIENLKYSQT
jgi:hypothetical protein